MGPLSWAYSGRYFRLAPYLQMCIRDRRRSLFAAALPAAFRWNKALIELYSRLTKRGKAHNEALIACARKLLIYANTVVQRGTPWTERPAAA